MRWAVTLAMGLVVLGLASGTALMAAPAGANDGANVLTNAGRVPAGFTVEAPVDGSRFVAASARGKYLAVHFLLKTECPVCLRHTREHAAAPADPGLVHLFLKPDSAEEIRRWTGRLGKGGAGEAEAGPMIYRDADAALARAYGVPFGYRFHGEVVHYPALVLLDPAGREVYRHVGSNNVDRVGPEQLAVILKKLRGDATAAAPRAGGVSSRATSPASSASAGSAGSAAAVTQYNLGPGRLALEGYDPVAYFVENRAVKGRADLGAEHRGVQYRFATEAARERFRADPERHLPAYGGWCATAMAKGEKVEIDPTNFKVTNGRLFLFFKAFYANALKDWNKDEPGLTSRADAAWRRLAGE